MANQEEPPQPEPWRLKKSLSRGPQRPREASSRKRVVQKKTIEKSFIKFCHMEVHRPSPGPLRAAQGHAAGMHLFDAAYYAVKPFSPFRRQSGLGLPFVPTDEHPGSPPAAGAVLPFLNPVLKAPSRGRPAGPKKKRQRPKQGRQRQKMADKEGRAASPMSVRRKAETKREPGGKDCRVKSCGGPAAAKASRTRRGPGRRTSGWPQALAMFLLLFHPFRSLPFAAPAAAIPAVGRNKGKSKHGQN